MISIEFVINLLMLVGASGSFYNKEALVMREAAKVGGNSSRLSLAFIGILVLTLADLAACTAATQEQTFSVSYMSNGATVGSVPVDSNEYKAGATATILGNTGGLWKPISSFQGWNTAANGAGTSYLPGATVTMNGDLVLYGYWPTASLSADVTTFAGSGTNTTVDGTGTAASFSDPVGLASDGQNLYVTQKDHTIRKIVISTGVVSTIAGASGVSGFTDGIGTAARFNNPMGIATDGTSLFIADRGNNVIRRMNLSTGEVGTLAGSGSSGSTDGTGSAASFAAPAGVATDGLNLYVCDTWTNIIRKIAINSAAVTTIAGLAGESGSIDGTGTAARFNGPRGLATDGVNLYVNDSNNATVRKIVLSNMVVSTLAGTAGVSGNTDGVGEAASFRFAMGIATDGASVFVADQSGGLIRQISIATRNVTTLAGGADQAGYVDGNGTAARFSNGFYGLAFDGTSLFVADTNNQRIRRID
jgi:hypothetical protein